MCFTFLDFLCKSKLMMLIYHRSHWSSSDRIQVLGIGLSRALLSLLGLDAQENRCGGFHKWGYPWIIDFNGIFPYKPSILGYPHWWKPSDVEVSWNRGIPSHHPCLGIFLWTKTIQLLGTLMTMVKPTFLSILKPSLSREVDFISSQEPNQATKFWINLDERLALLWHVFDHHLSLGWLPHVRWATPQ